MLILRRKGAVPVEQAVDLDGIFQITFYKTVTCVVFCERRYFHLDALRSDAFLTHNHTYVV